MCIYTKKKNFFPNNKIYIQDLYQNNFISFLCTSLFDLHEHALLYFYYTRELALYIFSVSLEDQNFI